MTGENALLLEVAGPGTPDEYGDVATGGAATWTGRVPAHLIRERSRQVSGGAVVSVERDVLVVLGSHGAPVGAVPGDQAQATTVLVEDRRTQTPVTRRFRVIAAENRAAGTPADSLRLELADERTT